jgi:hypothetical protein
MMLARFLRRRGHVGFRDLVAAFVIGQRWVARAEE